jgi:hypothetical protein
MDLEVIGELGDALAEERDLHLAGPGVAGLALVLKYDLMPPFGVCQLSTFCIRERV